jgi:hypothetical protein
MSFDVITAWAIVFITSAGCCIWDYLASPRKSGVNQMTIRGYDAWKLMSPDDERDAREEGLRGECDCCGKRRPLSRVWYHGIETWACGQCQDPDAELDRRRDDAMERDR